MGQAFARTIHNNNCFDSKILGLDLELPAEEMERHMGKYMHVTSCTHIYRK